MVTPSVYIGLGTSGTEIIQGVRRLLYDEYGVPGLPCVRFLSLETHTNLPSTDQDIYVRDENLAWQHLQVISLALTRIQLQQLRSKIAPTERDYHPGWAEWLDPQVLMGSAFTTGAKGWRMAGRLCLWANWRNVYEGLIQNIQSAIHGRDETITLLERHYATKGISRPETDLVEPSLRIYVCGSLCGGTCSGTFWEIGYMAHEAVADAAVGHDPDIHGVFTVVDRKTANSLQKSDIVCSMNCWAALLEYDYWASGENAYQVLHPLDPNSRFPTVPNDFGPYQVFNIISPSNDSGYRSVSWNGQDYDLTPLHVSISTSLYLDQVREVKARKDGDRAQYAITGQINRKSPNGLYRQRIQTYGLSGFYYPKFMIASAAACQLSQELVEHWCGEGNRNNAMRAAHRDWDEIYHHIRSQLLRIGNMDFIEHARNHLQDVFDGLGPKSLHALIQYLKMQVHVPVLPGSPLLVEALQPNGALQRHFEQEANGLITQMVTDITKKVEQHINAIQPGETTSLDEVVQYIEELVQRLQETINGLPGASGVRALHIPWNSLRGMSLRFGEISKDWWLRITFSRNAIQKYYLAKAIEDIQTNVRQQINQLADQVMRTICEKVQPRILGDASLGGFQTSTLYDDIRERLNRLRNRIVPALQNRWLDITRERTFGSLRMVTSRETIAQDAELLANAVRSRLRPAEIYRELLTDGTQSLSFYRFLCQEPGQIEQKLIQYYQPECWRTAQSINILHQLATDRFSQQTLVETARGSHPWLQFTGGQVPDKGCDEPDLIIGPRGSENRLNQIVNQVRTQDENLPSFQPVEGILDNMVVFYNEAAALSLQDWQLEPVLDNLLKHGGRTDADDPVMTPFNNHYTHKLGNLRYHPKLRRMVAELKFWIEAASLFQDPMLTQDFLYLDSQSRHLTYVYTSHMGLRDTVDLTMESEIAEFARADDGEAARTFIERVREVLKDLGQDNVEALANELWEAHANDRSRQREIKQITERVIQQLFPGEIRPRNERTAPPAGWSPNEP